MMQGPGRVAVSAALAAAVSVPLAARQAPVPLNDLLARAGAYVTRYTAILQNVVAEETYAQTAYRTYPGGTVMGRNGAQQVLTSDILLVKVGPPLEWRPLRDVYRVDDQPVRDHEQRLVALFSHPVPDAVAQALRIATESARYNIGTMSRTVNAPGLPLLFLQPAVQPRFRFSIGRRDSSTPAGVEVVRFQEQARPTIFRGDPDANLPSTGQLWIQRDSGAVMRTEHELGGMVSGRFTTSFQFDAAFGLAVPWQFTEDGASPSGRVTGRATYANFRQFGVKTETTLGAVAP